jgi:retron-type reverse transcriptase
MPERVTMSNRSEKSAEVVVHSYGFRPGRRAHDAVLAAQSYVQSGRRVVVDVDLEKFFDRVNHDILIDGQ